MKKRRIYEALSLEPSISRSAIRILFFLLVLSLPLLRPNLRFLGQKITLPDLIFGVLIVLWLGALALGKTRVRWHRVYWSFLLFFVAMSISAVFSDNHYKSFVKLAGILYLIGLAVITFNLVESFRHLRTVYIAWFLGSIVVLAVALLTIVVFYVDPSNPLLQNTVSIYGAAPVGNYPRLQSTLISASMLCNYLSVSLGLLFIADLSGWINEKTFHFYYFCLLLVALFTVSIGLGGFAVLPAVWIWVLFRNRHPIVSKTVLWGGAIAATLFVLVSFVSFESYKDVPYSFKFPVIQKVIYPSSRTLVWTESIETFRDNPITGVGIDVEQARVAFKTNEGKMTLLTDAHNVYLSIAAQTGLFGLFALLFLLFNLCKEFAPEKFDVESLRNPRFALGLTFVFSFIYQGLFSSFEDTRHIWVLIGLILSFGRTIKGELNADKASLD